MPAPTTETDPAALGAEVATGPARIKLIAATTYVPDAVWEPRELGQAEGALMLLSHSVTIRADPSRVLELVSKATAGARAYESDRGDADETAVALLDLLAHA